MHLARRTSLKLKTWPTSKFDRLTHPLSLFLYSIPSSISNFLSYACHWSSYLWVFACVASGRSW